MDELVRLSSYSKGEKPPPVEVKIEFSTNNPHLTVENIKTVMRVVVQYSADKWPDDETWKKCLPQWFVSRFEKYTYKELISNENLWHFGSWLESMKQRGWQWWSCQCTENKCVIYLTASEFVYLVGPLKYLIYESGGENIDVADELEN